ncbi:Hydroxymethylpyrimidine ABC transporter, transmembrane component [Clostridiaceae bacterium JG1575]|nr:Hydroxymethylpyrimidine ABC transporter, transmembrane component [Clostridiaceae bacterium JG1575]
MKKRASIKDKLISWSALLTLLILWQILSLSGMLPGYLVPSPIQVLKALVSDAPLLLRHSGITLLEALLGLGLGVVLGFFLAVLMDGFAPVKSAMYPLVVISQTVPTVAIAPLLVLWFGYGILPKVLLIILTTFFPIAIGLLSGFADHDADGVNLLRSMGASPLEIFWHIKLPSALHPFFASLRIAASYSIVGAVIAEWLGGFSGLGVYMTRVRKAYSYDKMFAVIFVISLLSLLLMAAVNALHRKLTPWDFKDSDPKSV